MKLPDMHRDILRIALPSIASNIMVPLLGLIDMNLAGHLGSPSYIGAIALSSTLFNMMYWLFAFLRMGTTGLSAQAFGRNDREELIAILLHSALVALCIGLAIIVIHPLILQGLNAYAGDTAIHAARYFGICIWGAPAVLGLYSLTGWFIGIQEARYPLYIALLQGLTNIAASLFFVYELHYGIGGVALGTLTAQYAGLAVATGWAVRHCRRQAHDGFPPLRRLWEKVNFNAFFTVNRDIFFRTLCLIGVTGAFTFFGMRQGETVLAVNAVLMQFFTLYSFFMDGFAFAAEALSGRQFGAGQSAGLQHTVKALFRWGGIMALLTTLLYIGGGKVLVALLTDQESVRTAALPYLPWVWVIPIAGMAAFLWDGIFIGLTATFEMLVSMAWATLVFFSVHLLLQDSGGNHALWLSFVLYLAVRGGIQTFLYRRLKRNRLGL